MLVSRSSDQLAGVHKLYGEIWASTDAGFDAAIAAPGNPRGPELLFDYAASLGLDADHRVLDIGARDAIHAIELARRHGCRVVAADPVPIHLDLARQRLAEAEPEVRQRVELSDAAIEHLPFADDSFDLVLCAFGVMFFPDKVGAGEEARRVLRAGGRYLLVTFDRLALNPVPKAAEEAVAALFPDDPPEYMERGPFSYADPARIEHDLRAAGFTDVELETTVLSSRVGARDAAQGIVLGSPFRAEIERRDPSALDGAVDAVAAALLPWDGRDAPMSAHVVTSTK